MSIPSLYSPRRHSIGLTALIDVIFILLLFFMLTSTFTRWRAVDLQVPDVGETESAKPPQIILLDETGGMKLHGNAFSVAHYSALTAGDLPAFELERPLAIVPEGDTNIQIIIAAIESLKGIGLPHVVLGNSLPPKTGQAEVHD